VAKVAEGALAAESGCDGFLSKPYREQEMFEMIEKHLGARFIYRDDELNLDEKVLSLSISDEATIAAFSKLPSEVLEEFDDAIDLCDIDKISRALEKIRNDNDLLATALEPLINDFRYGEVLNLIREASGKNGSN
jgi:hypothetical protein